MPFLNCSLLLHVILYLLLLQPRKPSSCIRTETLNNYFLVIDLCTSRQSFPPTMQSPTLNRRLPALEAAGRDSRFAIGRRVGKEMRRSKARWPAAASIFLDR